MIVAHTGKPPERGNSVDTTPGNSTKRAPRKSWKLDSLEYREFVAICEFYKLHTAKKLPINGSRDHPRLNAFVPKGLGDGKQFSQAQLTRKFDHWQASLVKKQATKEKKLSTSKLFSTEEIIQRVKKATVWSELKKEHLIQKDRKSVEENGAILVAI